MVTPARRATLLVVAAMAVGMGIRIANMVWWRPLEVPPIRSTDFRPEHRNALVLGGDAFSYHYQANALAAGHGYADGYRYANLGDVTPSAAHPPGFSTYLAAFSLVGLDSPAEHRFASSLLSLVTIAGVAGAARRLVGGAAGERAGNQAAVIGAWLVALSPAVWINDTMLLSESLAQAAVAVFLYASIRLWKERSWPWAAAAGVSAAVATLTRNEQIVLFGVLLVMVVARRGERLAHSLRLAAVAGLCGAVLIVPWVVRNLVTFDHTTILTTGTGAALSAASCAETYSGPSLGWYYNCFQGPFPDKVLDPRTGFMIEVDSSGRPIDESGRDIEPMRQAREWITGHWSEYPKVVSARVGRLWGWFRPAQTTRFEIALESRGGWQSWAALAGLYLTEIAGVAGLVVMRRRGLPISPVLALIGVATFGAAITFGVGRYRSTAEIALLLASAIALSTGWSAGRSLLTARRRSRDQTASTPIPPSTTQTTSAATR